MIRKVTAQDREIFLALLDEFYHSEAVMHPIPSAYFSRTFEQIVQNSPFVEAYLFETSEGIAGYAQVSYTYSNEAGGLTAWIEEVYVRPAFQGQGLGAAFFTEFERQGKAKRLRLEVEADNAGAMRLYERLGYRRMPYLQMYKECEG